MPKKPPPAFPDAGFGFDLADLKRIYSHLGSEARVAEIVQDFYRRMSTDILLGFFFDNRDVKEIAEKQLSFLLRAMGASPTYSGRPPNQAHLTLPPILSGHFDRRLKLLEETLVAHGLRDTDIQTWVKFENAFRDAIVSPEKT